MINHLETAIPAKSDHTLYSIDGIQRHQILWTLTDAPSVHQVAIDFLPTDTGFELTRVLIGEQEIILSPEPFEFNDPEVVVGYLRELLPETITNISPSHKK